MIRDVVVPPVVQIREYHAILNTVGTSNPTANVLHNTYNGEIVWTRETVGNYIGTLIGELKAGKTAIQVTNGDTTNLTAAAELGDNNGVYITNFDTTTGTNEPVDNLVDAYVIIRTYNI